MVLLVWSEVEFRATCWYVQIKNNKKPKIVAQHSQLPPQTVGTQNRGPKILWLLPYLRFPLTGGKAIVVLAQWWQ